MQIRTKVKCSANLNYNVSRTAPSKKSHSFPTGQFESVFSPAECPGPDPHAILSSTEPSYQICYKLTHTNTLLRNPSWQALLTSLSSVASTGVSLISAHRSTGALVLIKEPFLKFLLILLPFSYPSFPAKAGLSNVEQYASFNWNHTDYIKVFHVRTSARGTRGVGQVSTITSIL